MHRVGGTGAEQQANENIQTICDRVKVKVEGQLNAKFEKFVAVTYTTQCVAGTNYFIKVDVGPDEDHVHLRIFKKLPCHVQEDGEEYQLTSVKRFSKDQPIGHF